MKKYVKYFGIILFIVFICLVQLMAQSSADIAKSEQLLKDGNAAVKEGKIDDAIQLYTQAIKLTPNNATLFVSRAIAFGRKGNFEAANQDLTQAIKLNPQKADYYYYRANGFANVKNCDAAIPDYTQAIKLESNNSKFYYGRAVCYDAQRKYNLAIDDFTQAIKFNPDSSAIYQIRASVYRKLNKIALAVADEKKAAEMWQYFKGDEFSVFMPPKVERQYFETPTEAGIIPTNAYSASENNHFFRIMVSPNPFAVAFRQYSETLKIANESFFRNYGSISEMENGICAPYRNANFSCSMVLSGRGEESGVIVLHFRLVSNNRDVGAIRFYFTERKQYAAGIQVFKTAFDKLASEKFLNSFRVTTIGDTNKGKVETITVSPTVRELRKPTSSDKQREEDELERQRELEYYLEQQKKKRP